MNKNCPVSAHGVCTVESPCKINLHLRIGEKRPDGFHNLESIFAALAFGDSLRFERMEGEGASEILMKAEGPGGTVPPEKNLIYRALALFRERTGYRAGFRVTVDKRIPLGAGLGGGSSNAASTLLALDSLANTRLPAGEMKEMALSLGSDVPFFLLGGAAFVSGRGEYAEPVAPPRNLLVILVKPPFESNTARAYGLLDKTREQGTGERGPVLAKEALVRALYVDPETWPFYNDFLPVFRGPNSGEKGEEREHAAFYRSIFDEFRGLGASFAGLSGSGSCCFGIFKNRNLAETAEKTLSRQGIFVRLTFFVARKAKLVLQ